MVTTSGLLSQNLRVTMLTAPNMPPEGAIRSALSLHMPCEQQLVAQALLSIKPFYIHPQALPCPQYYNNYNNMQDPTTQSPADVIYCSIVNAAPMVKSMSESLATVDQPSVLLLDGTSVAGLLIAEHFLIPSLMIVESVEVLRHILGEPSSSVQTKRIQHKKLPQVNKVPASQYYDYYYRYHYYHWLHPVSVYRMIQDRLNSVDLATAFIALNRVRQSLGLQRLRTVSDLWKAPGSLLWSPLADAKLWQPKMRNLLVYSGPFLPPCAPCNASVVQGSTTTTSTARGAESSNVVVLEEPQQQQHSLLRLGMGGNKRKQEALAASAAAAASVEANLSSISHNNKQSPVIIVTAGFHDDHLGRRNLRSLIHGLSMARESVRAQLQQEQNNETIITSNSSDFSNTSTNKWRAFSDVRFVLTGPKMIDFVLPPFVVHSEAAFLDVLAVFQPTIALVSLCDLSNGWTQQLGPPVLCLDLRWTPTELAQQLLSLIEQQQQPSSSSSSSVEPEIGNKQLDPQNSFHPHHHHKKPAKPATSVEDYDDVLARIIFILKELSKVKVRDGDDWMTGWEMGQDVMRQLNLLEKTTQRPDSSSSACFLASWLRLPAYYCFGVILLYLLVKDSKLAQWCGPWLRVLVRTRRWPRGYARTIQLWVNTSLEWLSMRFLEVNNVEHMWNSWSQDISNQMIESNESTSEGGGGGNSNHHNNKGHVNGVTENGFLGTGGSSHHTSSSRNKRNGNGNKSSKNKRN
jgi:hypothetical protein